MRDRAVSSPVGVILLIGITITAVTALFLVGGSVLSDTRADAEQSQTENSMSQFSSKASLVGLGESGDQRFSLGRISSGEVTVQPDAGQVTVFLNRSSWSDRKELHNTSFGAVVYRSGNTEIAYQGGGVWERRSGGSQMVSPPEYHYQLETLTFPIMTVSGEGGATGDVRGTVRAGSESQSWYPVQGNDNLSNPLEEGTVIVRVESRYCRGWESFFEQRSQGILQKSCNQGDSDTLEVDLVVPFQIESDTPVKAKGIDPGTGNSEVPSEWEEGVSAPSISPEVEKRIQECANGSCDSLKSSGSISSIGDDELYWAGSDHTFDSNVTFETEGNDITAVVDGNLDISADIEINGTGSVTIYVRESVQQNGHRNINTGGGADQFAIQVHTDGESVTLQGTTQYTGVIYAPGSEISIGGNVEIKGSVVGETIDLSGDPPEFEQADELEDYQIAGGDRSLAYLHVSENPIEVELD